MASKADNIRAALAEHGAKRESGLDTADDELDAIVELLDAATEQGIPIAEIHRLTGVSRPTLYARRDEDPAKASARRQARRERADQRAKASP